MKQDETGTSYIGMVRLSSHDVDYTTLLQKDLAHMRRVWTCLPLAGGVYDCSKGIHQRRNDLHDDVQLGGSGGMVRTSSDVFDDFRQPHHIGCNLFSAVTSVLSHMTTSLKTPSDPLRFGSRHHDRPWDLRRIIEKQP